MPAPPSHIFVVRHGNRLDAADKKWHLSSPTPYDPPLTYGGFQQARQVGNQIWSILEQAKLEFDVAHESSSGTPLKRRRYKIVIHSSPFLRCVQTSIGISSGLCQATPGSIYLPSDVIVPPVSPNGSLAEAKSAVLRLDSFLGEWLSPEYFESITPPPGSALMMGGAKAELLRRSDYSELDDLNAQQPSIPTGALWNSSASSDSAMSTPSEVDSVEDAAANSRALLARRGYVAPKPNYAASSVGKIPDGFVSHARDACVVVDYQWDSMRAPLDFGDGGNLGEEWAAMHRRFRKGLRQLVNWYCTNEAPAVPVSTSIAAAKALNDQSNKRIVEDEVEEDVQTVVILVSHGAGCNALMGAITHQPVLMDVGIASITMAERKQDVDYAHLQMATKNDPQAQYGVPVDRMYDIKLSASKEHLQSTSSRPGSARSNRSPSISNIWNGGSRGRTSTLGSLGGAVMSPFKYSEIPSTIGGSRSASASATVQPHGRRNSAAHRPVRISNTNAPVDGPISGSPASPSMGLWSPAGSSLRLMQDDDNDSDADTDDFDQMWPNFGQDRFQTSEPPVSIANPSPPVETGAFEWASRVKRPDTPTGPTLSAPIKIQTNLTAGAPVEEVKMTSLGDGFGGLWGLPRPPDDAERYRDTSLSKRRWTVNEQS